MPFPRRLLPFTLALLQLAGVARATLGPALQSQLGNPSGATAAPTAATNYLIARPQYALSHNNTTREPNWVSWDLTTADVGSSGRSANFFQDITLPAGFYQVLTTDYSGSGYDRGHMCPSGDRTVTDADNEVTFFMSNMIPQAPDNNQGVWANFESECRTLAAAGNEILITSGPSGFTGTTIASGVAVAGYTWKIAVVVPLGPGTALSRITATTRVIAIKIPNIAGVRSNPWQNYITTAAQIQSDTGYTFFSEVPATVAAALRTKVDGAAAVGSPTVTTQPAAQTAAVGGNATFTVAAAGDATLTYQWSRDEVELTGATATTATLTLTNLKATDAGNYSVVIKNSVGSITSAAVSLVITGLPPVIVTPPAARTVSAGTAATFAVVTSGSPTLSYQWRRAGLPIPASTNASASTATLTLARAQAADAASYDVVVTNSVGSVTSAAALLAVTPAAPSIATAPAAQTVTPGGTATLSVVASGSGPFTYQWRKTGVAITGNASATTATLTLPVATVADSGSYEVVITNSLGTTTSAAITLDVTVTPPPALLWDFVAAVPKSGLPADVTGGTVVQRNNNGTTLTLTTVSASGGYPGVSGTSNAGAAARVGPLNLAEGGSAFFEFTLTPAAGRQLAVTGLNFGARSTATGPQAYALLAVNGSGDAALIASGPLANNSVWTLITPAFLPIVSVAAAPLTFRLYGYGGAGNAGGSTANWRIDDLAVNLTTGTGLFAGDAVAQRLVNLSSRVRAANGGDVAIAGFTIAGTTPKPVLIRAAGP
ncbi:MAG: DNA/RNA non-specific endonuclease, partial [Undibacterium sp.]|nr:DNA/RNA non-specific endonuclease [Opitutaceae bacterium]